MSARPLESIGLGELSWSLRAATAALPDSVGRKLRRALSILTMANLMNGHAKGRALRARARRIVDSLPPDLRTLAREWIARGIIPYPKMVRRARRVPNAIGGAK